MLTDDEVRDRLIDTARAAAEAPPSTEEVLQAGRRQRWRMRLAVGALVMTGALIFVTVAYAGFYGRDAVRPFNIPLVDQPTEVPDVEGLTLGEAEERLEDAGLKADPATSCEQGAPCEVLGQSPRKGTRVEEGTAVKLTLGPRGPERVTVPPVEGLAPAGAVARLRREGLRARYRGESCEGSAPKCFVNDQSPEADARRPRRSFVVLTLEFRRSRPGPAHKGRRGDGLVTVPSVTGLTRKAATGRLRRAGFNNVAFDVDCPDPATPCLVRDQAPNAGRRVKRGRDVKLTLRGGEVSVPDVIGFTEAAARDRLEERGFEPVGQECAPAATCTVIGQDPDGGDKVPRGTEVTLYLDETPEEQHETTTVPDVEGDAPDVAKSKLKDAGLEFTVEGTCPEGKECEVATQSPAADEEVDVGTEITLTLHEVEEPSPEGPSTAPEEE